MAPHAACMTMTGLLMLLASSEAVAYHYGNPYDKAGCMAKEINMSVQGVPGLFCAPKCDDSVYPTGCPQDKASGVARGECMIAVNGTDNNYCALICNVDAPADQCDVKGGAHCHHVSGVQGVCTYASPSPDPAGDVAAASSSFVEGAWAGDTAELAKGANTFIVVFQEAIAEEERSSHMLRSAHWGVVQHEFSIGTLAGYVIETTEEASANALRNQAEVAYVEKDVPMHLKSQGKCVEEVKAPSWGLQRVSETTLPLTGTYSYPSGVGSGADVYVLDTGVRTTHEDFQGRASFGFNAAGGKIDTDKDGHGTAVAGIIAGAAYGICKQCNIISVKIFTDDGDTSASPIIAAFNWVAKHFDKGRKIIINISVGGDPGETSDAMDAAVNALVSMGVHVVGAAGNENVDACTESPGRASGIVGVGSTDVLLGTSDIFLGGSNFGKCVKILAPGNSISSLGCSSDTAVAKGDLSGTSFASPHVAGVLAELAVLNENASLAEVQQLMYSSALKDVVTLVPKGTKNILLHKACPTRGVMFV